MFTILGGLQTTTHKLKHILLPKVCRRDRPWLYFVYFGQSQEKKSLRKKKKKIASSHQLFKNEGQETNLFFCLALRNEIKYTVVCVFIADIFLVV